MKTRLTGFGLVFMITSMAVAAQEGDAAAAGYKPIPPKFTLEASPEKVLKAYPLGSINKMAAFSHHGKALKTVTLVNGLTGWVYEVHRGGNMETFEKPTGEEVTTMDTYDHPPARTYTLVFDESGEVVDVLYRDIQHGNTDSALLVQREEKGDSPSESEFPPTK